MRRVGVRHDQLGERVVLHLGQEIEAGEAAQVVEAVAVLQRLELGLEHEVEGRAEHAAERHLLLGQAADPQVDVVEAGDGDAVEVRGLRAVAHVPVLFRKSRRSCQARRAPPSTSSVAAARLSASVVGAGDRARACRRRR